MEPMLLKPFGKETIWGGSRLITQFGKKFPTCRLGETWECSTHPDGPSIIVNGEFSGINLKYVLDIHPEYLGNRVERQFGLPILVKFIDAKDNLSIQVHPNDDFARKKENDFGKTEMWYVLDAENDAEIIHGFSRDVSNDLLKAAMDNGCLEKYLNKIQVHQGDTFFTPAGTVHGIGAGCLIAEIQENSNITYRVYDYDRIDKDGKKRELHFEKAMSVLDMHGSTRYGQKSRLIHYYTGGSREIICRCQYFETELIKVTKGVSFTVTEESFQVLLFLNGRGGLETSEYQKPLRLKKGDCVFLPAKLGRCFIIGECELLKIRV